MIVVLLFGGFLRSLFFSGVNALAFSDIAKEDISQATPIAAVAQQASMALGIAIAGAVLEIASSFHDNILKLSDFHTGFFVVGFISALAFFIFRTLPRDAGHALNEKSKQSTAQH